MIIRIEVPATSGLTSWAQTAYLTVQGCAVFSRGKEGEDDEDRLIAYSLQGGSAVVLDQVKAVYTTEETHLTWERDKPYVLSQMLQDSAGKFMYVEFRSVQVRMDVGEYPLPFS